MHEGKFVAIPIDLQFGKAKTGSHQVGVQFRVIRGVCEDERITWYGSFANQKAQEITFKGLQAMGWNPSTGLETAVDVLMEPTPVEIAVITDDYNGVSKLKVMFVNRIGVVMKERVTGGELTSFFREMAGAVTAFSRDGGSRENEREQQRREYQSSRSAPTDDVPHPASSAPPWER